MKRQNQNKLTDHHLIPQSRGGGRGVNLKRLKLGRHQVEHIIFDTKHTIEKIIQIIDFDTAILDPAFKELIMHILEIDPKDAYIREAFKSTGDWKNLKTEQ